MGGQLDVKPI